MSKTNTRLQKLVDEIDNAEVIADIGTDHGYLPIMAVKQHKTEKAFASDVAKDPLKSAKDNVKAAGLTAAITVLLTDGLTYYKKNNIHLDYCIIAGLGSITISEILGDDYKNIDNYLICSNTEPSAILKIAKKKKLRVVKETYFIDKERKYWLLSLSRTKGLKIKTFKDIYVGMDSVLTDKPYLGLLKDKLKDNVDHLKHIKRFSKRYRFINKQNKKIREVLDNGTGKNR